MDAILRAIFENDFAKSIARASGAFIGENIVAPIAQLLLPLLGL